MIGQWKWVLLLAIFLLSDGSANLSVTGQEKKTAVAFSMKAAQVDQAPSKLNDDLVKAAKDGKTAKAQALLAKGASPDAHDKKGHSALGLAFTAEAYDTVRVLLDSGAATLNAEPPLADFVFVWALQRNRMDVVEAMKARSASAGNEHGRRAINDAIRTKGGLDRETLLRLVTNGAPLGVALPESVADGNTEVARILLDHGADVNVQRDARVLVRFDEEQVSRGVPGAWMSITGVSPGVGRDALMEAVMTDNGHLVQLLLDKGAKPNRQMVVYDAKQVQNLPADVVTISFALLLTASVEATVGQMRMVSGMMSKGTAKQLRPTKEVTSTPFCMARSLNNSEILSLLVKHGGEGSCNEQEPTRMAKEYFNRGSEYAEKGELDRAIQEFSRAISLDPKDAEAYNNRGRAYIQIHKDNYGRALQDFTEAISVDPKFAEDLDRAIQDFTQVISLNPKLAEAYYNRGLTYTIKGDFDRAIQDFTQAISLDSKFVLAYQNRAKAYRALAKNDLADADEKKGQKFGGKKP